MVRVFVMCLAGLAVVGVNSGLVWADSVEFEGDVWPILAEHCIRCHGTEKQEGDLRLDTPEGIRTGGEYGEIIATGKPEDSTLIELTALPEDDPDVMPSKGDALDAEEIETLTRWITEGASLEGWTQSMADTANAEARGVWEKKDSHVVVLPASFRTSVKTIQFNRDIRPILSNNCFKCHGQDTAARKADLRLDLEEHVFSLREGGHSIIEAGKPRKSELVKRIFHGDAEEIMPPEKSGRTLTDAEKHLLAAWIEQGAEYEPHWSFIAPERPEVAKRTGDSWSRNPIDVFISTRLRSEKLSPSSKADPVTLVRRLYHDLTGLPPTPDVVNAFALNPTDQAYTALVESLLASEHYGERMAVNWLDQVRYADSNGYHSDEERMIYPYRDYVIDSFNENKPFDRFTIEQLAGDLLESPTREELVATGFNRLNQITAEGGAQSKEYRAKYNADRVRALGSVWMGATLGCVECHEHKYDPYEPKDFYQFAAFFADIEEDDVYPGMASRWEPILLLPTEEEQTKIDEIQAEILRLSDAAYASNEDSQARAAKWHKKQSRKGKRKLNKEWRALTPVAMETEAGGSFEVQDDLSILSVGLDAPQDVHTFRFVTDQEKITALRFDALNDPSFRLSLSRHRHSVRLNECEILVKTAGMDEARPVKIAGGSFTISEDAGALKKTFDGDLVSHWKYQGKDDAERRRPLAFMYEFDEAIAGGVGTEITVRLHYLGNAAGDRSAFGRVRVSATADKKPELENRVGAPERLVPSPSYEVERYFNSVDEERAESRDRLTAKYAEKRGLEAGMAYTLYTKRLPIPREVRFLPRGNWLDDSGPIVEPGIPDFLPPLEAESGRLTRLDLARWLVDEKNPFTARVFVNRLWKLYFGKGISAVLDDLGSQGEAPVHPELLDWLAVEFMESGWDVKHMVRLITASAAYQQSSVATAALLERDPQNRLIARQSSFRYEAEMVRDSALAVSGLLNTKVGGKSVRPYQPEGYWEHLNFPKREYTHDDDARQYRRGLYVHWQRSFLHPSMKAFDAPSREECVAERTQSNTPLQALALLNDPSFVEAAEAFGRRIQAEGGETVESKITWALQQGLLRDPSEEELQILWEVYEKHGAEDIAWTSIARIILNLHETITRS